MTQSLEDYLKTVGVLADKGDVRITDIAIRLGVSKPSVIIAVKALETQGFVTHKRYCAVMLTKQGKEKVSGLKERYQIILSFLQDVLGISPNTAKQDSCKMEHILSEETLKKIKSIIHVSGYCTAKTLRWTQKYLSLTESAQKSCEARRKRRAECAGQRRFR
jgi:DtxR family Mn-dependent transcriptional regulator